MRYSSIKVTMVVMLALLVATTVKGQEASGPPPLDAKLRVKVSGKLEPSCQFLLPGKMDQSFENSEYRYALLDKDGNEVDDAIIIKTVHRVISLPKDQRSVTDATDATLVKDKLTSGEEYYFVVSVRNLIGLAKFKAP